MQFVTIITITFLCYCDASKTRNWSKPKGKPSGCYDVICNSTATYPESHIKKLLNKKNKNYKKFFGSVIEPSEVIELPSFRSPRIGDAPRNFCETRKVTILPKIAYDENMNAQFIVNVKGREQRVSFEVCVQKKCFPKDLPLNYRSHCKQMYNKVGLLYITNKGVLKYGRFSVPSACVCTYIKAPYF